MRIAVASDDGVQVAAHSGRCREFVVFDVVDGKATRVEGRANRHTHHAQGQCGGHGHQHGHQHGHAHGAAPADVAPGHGCHGGILAALGDCKVFVAGGMGRRLVAGLLASGVTPYACAGGTVDEAAEAFASGKLTPLTPEMACQHQH